MSKGRLGHNAINAFDVTGDGNVSLIDAMEALGFLRVHRSRPMPRDGSMAGRYYDVNGDGRVTLLDAMEVVNSMNAMRRRRIDAGSGTAKGEGNTDSLMSLLAEDVAVQGKRKR